ncbi:MAG: hypothetical protein ACKPKO_57270, partial [Candidatus Fonsibacter sp.]
ADYHKLLSEVGPQDADLTLAPEVEKDISPVLGNIRHVTQTLANVDHLDQEYHKYAATTEAPLSTAAWIAQEMRKRLAGLTTSATPSAKRVRLSAHQEAARRGG